MSPPKTPGRAPGRQPSAPAANRMAPCGHAAGAPDAFRDADGPEAHPECADAFTGNVDKVPIGTRDPDSPAPSSRQSDSGGVSRLPRPKTPKKHGGRCSSDHPTSPREDAGHVASRTCARTILAIAPCRGGSVSVHEVQRPSGPELVLALVRTTPAGRSYAELPLTAKGAERLAVALADHAVRQRLAAASSEDERTPVLPGEGPPSRSSPSRARVPRATVAWGNPDPITSPRPASKSQGRKGASAPEETTT